MEMKFDGKKQAIKIEKDLIERVKGLEKKPVLVILWAGDSEASNRYVEMKQKVGERIGVEVRVDRVIADEMEEKVKKASGDKSVTGVMVQLPVPGVDKKELIKIIDLIPTSKDVDGLTSGNLKAIAMGGQEFLPATVKAVGKIVDEAIKEVEMDIEKMKVAVVGSKGMVGRPLVDQMKRFGFQVGEFDEGDELELSDYDVVVSATGKEGLIKPEMVKVGVIAIDVGFPKGDFDVGIEKKSAFYTPVPGGVGPVTVVCLLENLVTAASS